MVGVLAGDPLDQFQHRGDAGGTAHHHDLVEFGRLELGVLEGLLHRHPAAINQLGGQLFKLGAGEVEVEVLGALGGGGDERQVDLALGGTGELDLGLLGSLGEALQGLLVLAQVNALIGLEIVSQIVDDHLVEVIAAQVGVTGGGEHFEHAIPHFQHRHVEGAAAQVEHQDALIALAVKAVGQGRRSGLVDDAQHLKAGDLAGILGGLALGVVEVGGNGDHRLGDGFTEVFAGVFRQLAQHLGTHLLGGELLVQHRALHLDVGARLLDAIAHFLRLFVDLVDPTADEALDRIESVLGIHHRLTLGDLAHQLILVFGVGHHGRGRAEPFGVGYHSWLAALHHGDTAIRSA